VAARYWQAAALMEHASIAAFARFTLQLLQLGAPLELTLESQRAMRDETEHASRCFTLAARYAGSPLGPTALGMAGAFEEESMASIVRLAFREGCLGETCAALEASEALAAATDRAVCETLELIARDERRHAELAWHFIAWALEQDGAGEVRAVLKAEVRRLRAEQAETGSPSAGCRSTALESLLSHHGIVSAEHRGALRTAVITRLVLPCAEQLIATAGKPRRAAMSVSFEASAGSARVPA
jgi:hypothetical protein